MSKSGSSLTDAEALALGRAVEAQELAKRQHLGAIKGPFATRSWGLIWCEGNKYLIRKKRGVVEVKPVRPEFDALKPEAYR